MAKGSILEEVIAEAQNRRRFLSKIAVASAGAAAIGAGGLGELIFRGVASVDNGLVLAGAIPAAMLALVADAGLGMLEKKMSVRRA